MLAFPKAVAPLHTCIYAFLPPDGYAADSSIYGVLDCDSVFTSLEIRRVARGDQEIKFVQR